MQSIRILSSIGLSFTLMFATLAQAGTPVLEFGGDNSYVDLGSAAALQIDGNEPFTIEGWMYLNALSIRDMLYSKSATRPTAGPYTYMFGFRDGLLAAYDGSWQGDFSVPRQTGRWHHLAFSFDGLAMRYYLDGTYIGQSAFNFSNTETHQITIGGYHSSSDIEGYKSDFRAWDHARDAADIQNFMNYRLTGSEAGLLGYWPMDEGTGTQVFDGTANATTGTVVNATWTITTDLVLFDAMPAGVLPALAFTLANQETDSTRFTNSNVVDLLELPIPEGYDHFQVTEDGTLGALGTWSFTNAVPESVEFSKPATEGEVTLYAWFTNTTESVTLRRSQGSIIYTETGPDVGIVANLTRETAGFSVRINSFDIDVGSTGGTAAGAPMEIFAMEALWDDGPHPDATPDDPFVTLTNAGVYTVKLRIVNEAGNATLSAACTVTLQETVNPPSDGDRFVVLGNLFASHPYDTWASAAGSIQTAVNATTANGETVLVWPGRYTVPTNAVLWGGATNVVYLNKLLSLKGASGKPEDVIIDGEGQHRGIAVVHTASSTDFLLLDGLTVTNGFAHLLGGGIRVAPGAWNAIIQNCHIVDNLAYAEDTALNVRGGGLYAPSSGSWNLVVSNCVFRGNSALNAPNTSSARGGGFSLGSATILFRDCLIEDNIATIAGGGSDIDVGSLSPNWRFENTIFRNNRTLINHNAMSGGGGHFGSGVFVNCLFVGNGQIGAGAIFNDRRRRLTLINCTITQNTSSLAVWVRRNNPGDHLEMYNTIAYGNSGTDVNSGADENTIWNSCIGVASISGVIHGSGYISENPLFADPANGNFRLSRESPCINTGTNLPWMAGATDLDGKPRIDGVYKQVDMGAYEYQYAGTILFVR